MFKKNLILIGTASILSGCIGLNEPPKITEFSVNGIESSLILPIRDNTSSTDNFFDDRTSSTNVYSSSSYLVFLETTSFFNAEEKYTFRQGAYTQSASSGRRSSDSYIEYQFSVDCTHKDSYKECSLKTENSRKVEASSWVTSSKVPDISETEAHRLIGLQGLRGRLELETPYDQEIIYNELQYAGYLAIKTRGNNIRFYYTDDDRNSATVNLDINKSRNGYRVIASYEIKLNPSTRNNYDYNTVDLSFRDRVISILN